MRKFAIVATVKDAQGRQVHRAQYDVKAADLQEAKREVIKAIRAAGIQGTKVGFAVFPA